MYAKDFKQALETAEKVELGPDNRSGRAIISVMRATALFGMKKDDRARSIMADAEKLAPHEPDLFTTLFLGAMVGGRFDVAAEAFDRLISMAPDKVREMDSDLVWEFLRNEPEGQERKNEDRWVALAQLGYGGTSEDELTSEAIGILLKRGEAATAAELLKYLNDPTTIEEMLIQRRYAALWPKLEEVAGPHLQTVAKSALNEAQRDLSKSPDDIEKARFVVDALVDAGQLDEAIAMRSLIPSSREEMSAADQEMGWLVDSMASAYLAADRGEDADALYALLNEADIENGWWRVNMRINRVGALMKAGEFERAVALFDTTQSSANTEGNDYARQLVRRIKFCTFSQMGRKEEAAAVLPELLKHSDDAPGPTVDALLCGGQFDEAEKLVLSRPKKTRFELQLVITLQANPSSLSAPPVWQTSRQVFRQRPAIAAEFDRLGRDLPQQFMPAGKQVATN